MQIAAVIARVHAASQQGIRYQLGKGGFNPGSPTPGQAGRCDCSGYVAWCFGMSRQTTERFYRSFNGGWIETTAVWTDCGANVGIFDSLSQPRPGAVVVYPDDDGHQGHIGIVVGPNQVAHCSKGNDTQFGNAIRVTAPNVFNRPDVRYGWLVGLQ